MQAPSGTASWVLVVGLALVLVATPLYQKGTFLQIHTVEWDGYRSTYYSSLGGWIQFSRSRFDPDISVRPDWLAYVTSTGTRFGAGLRPDAVGAKCLRLSDGPDAVSYRLVVRERLSSRTAFAFFGGQLHDTTSWDRRVLSNPDLSHRYMKGICRDGRTELLIDVTESRIRPDKTFLLTWTRLPDR